MAMTAQPAVFLDKDGTLVKDTPYNIDADEIAFQAGAAPGLRKLFEAGFALVIVSNQSGIARGCFSEAEFLDYAASLRKKLKQEGGPPLEGFYYCPHHPEGSEAGYAVECDCRKPQPGLLLQAASDLNIDLERSWMVGDILHDVEAGRRAGCRTILIDNGGETEWVAGPFRTPHFYAADLREAAGIILANRWDGAAVDEPDPARPTGRKSS